MNELLTVLWCIIAALLLVAVLLGPALFRSGRGGLLVHPPQDTLAPPTPAELR